MLKRLAFVALIVASFTLTSISVNAASTGACSGHDGVDCLAGPDTDGSVLCIDGWNDSSVDYNEIRSVCTDTFTPFLDVDNTHENVEAIYTLYETNVIEGYDDFTFKPENQVNRAEFLKILIEGDHIFLNPDAYNNCFSDVEDGWFAKYVCFAESEGWVEGYEDGTFKPGQTVNKAEAIKILLEIHGYAANLPTTVATAPYNDVPTDAWFAPYVEIAKEKGFINGDASNNLNPDALMSRAAIAEMTYRSIVVKADKLDSYTTVPTTPIMPEVPEVTISTADFTNATEPRTLGDSDAVIEIIGYNDYQCPFCKVYVDDVLHQLTTDYIETGKVKYTFKDFPLSFHVYAKDAAHAARCAEDQGKFFEMHDLLFAGQSDWSYVDDIDTTLALYATELELDATEFETCMTSGTHTADINQDMAEGVVAGINGTPAMIVNGEVIVGAPQYDLFSEYLDELYADLTNGT